MKRSRRPRLWRWPWRRARRGVTGGSRSSVCKSTRAERMDLALTESQEMLRSAARSFVEREAPRHTIVALQRAESSLVPDLWRKASELGWLGMLIPERH